MSIFNQQQSHILGQNFLNYVNRTGSPYHSVEALCEMLEKRGFRRLKEEESWGVYPDGKFYVTRNGSAIMCFIIGKDFSFHSQGHLSIVTTHTDSPCLRLKPHYHSSKAECLQVGVQCYGGGLWHTWFDRGLGLAGKVVVRKKDNTLEERLVHVAKPLMYIPNLAIHLQNQEERTAFKINKEEHLKPVLCSVVTDNLLRGNSGETCNADSPLCLLLSEQLRCEPSQIASVDICLMDATPSRFCGLYEEFIESPRLDNLLCSFSAFEALSDMKDPPQKSPKDNAICMAVAFDHEECGSQSWAGADSKLMENWTRRILLKLCNDTEELVNEVLSRSFLISADMAHGLHPNYMDKHQSEHRPVLGGGIVIKHNSNQRYTTECTSASIVKELAEAVKVPVQNFVVKNDVGCGGTVGPFLSSSLGLRSLDIGVCQWAMHSCRELSSVQDLTYLTNFFKYFFGKYNPRMCKYI